MHDLTVRRVALAKSSYGDSIPFLGMIVGIDNFSTFITSEPVNYSLYELPTIFGSLFAGTIK